jgi:hypothetical protein
MTHADLVKKVEHYDYVAAPYLIKALLAVVGLHKPIEGYEHLCGACWFGDGMMSYPCPTIQAIEEELV